MRRDLDLAVTGSLVLKGGGVRHTLLRGEVVYDGEQSVGGSGGGELVQPVQRKGQAYA